MTGKKKINLGPLPEELDYSKYEETVTRWDRVIAVILGGLIILAVLIYLLLGHSQPTKEVAAIEQASDLPAVAVASLNSQEMVDEPVKEEPEANVQMLAEQPVQQVEESTDSNGIEKANNPVSQEVQPEQLTDKPQSQSPTTDANVASAAVSIINPAITQAILSDQQTENGPGAPLAETLVLPDTGITKVMLFTTMKGLSGRTLFHEWYRNGERQARVKIPVSEKEQRSFSSKFINLQMIGDWQVKVVDSKGKAYVDAVFKVIQP